MTISISNRNSLRSVVACGCMALSLFGGSPAFAADPKAKTAEAAAPAGGNIKWVENFDAAKKSATADKKDLLIDFTGSDWCGWCIRLKKEVFDQDAFAPAAKDFVFVELDYPNAKPQTDEIKKQNAKLKNDFSIEGYPTIILADAKGLPYAQTGYQEGGPDKYLQHLADLKKARVQRDEAWAGAAEATGVDKAKLLAKGLDALDVGLVVNHYQSVVDEIKKLDPKDESGAAGKFGFQLDLNAANKKLAEQNGVTAAQAREAMDKVIAAHPKADGSQKQQALFNVINYCRPPADNEFVMKLMDEVVAVAPESEIGKNAAKIKAQIAAKLKPAADIAAGGAIDASKVEAITAAKGKSVVVEGEVKSVEPTKAGGHLNIFLAPGDKGLLLFIRKPQLDALNESHNGDFAKAIAGQRVRVRGTVQDFGGKGDRLKGRLQIAITATDQIQLLKEAAK